MIQLKAVVNQLQAERKAALSKIERIDQALHALGSVARKNTGKGTLSLAARKRIAAAQKARWAKWRAAKRKKAA